MSLSSAVAAPKSVAGKQHTFLGHPVGLYVLFFTEMWERFSYYGMRALLMLYMLNYFRMLQKDASTVYKVYTSFVYVTPIIGGYLADRYLGNKRAVIIGAILMAIGHFLMAFEETMIFYSALVFLMIGNGFFKPNMSTQVGRLYPANDGRRDGAYTIFYMGINLGAFLSPLVCGWLAENTVGGYHTGFTMAGIGMVIGLVIYLLGQPLVRELPPDASGTSRPLQNETPESVPSEAITAKPVKAEAVLPPAEIEGAKAAASHEEMVGPPPGAALVEADAERVPSTLGKLAGLLPGALTILGVLILIVAPIRGVPGAIQQWKPELFEQWVKSFPLLDSVAMNIWDAIMLAMGGVCLLIVANVARRSAGGMRDRVITILVLGVFVMFFWAAFEQAGNVLNVWADKHTDRYLTQPAPPVSVKPEVIEDTAKGTDGEPERGAVSVWQRFATMFQMKPRPAGKPEESWAESLNPVPAAWFQSINALAIFILAPLFAWMWIFLDRRRLQPSIPMKMFLGLVMMSASVAIMIAAANQENKPSSVVLKGDALPQALVVKDGGKVGLQDEKGEWEPLQAGRLTYDAATRTLHMTGVLPDNERDLMIESTAPDSFRKQVEALKKESEKIDDYVKSVQVKLTEVPPGFDMSYAGLKKTAVVYRPDEQTLVAYQKLADKEVKGLLVAGGDPKFRDSINELYVASNTFRVSSWWLFWSYILATLGELCLSPVGLSMVSKLAPAKSATMLMGVWMLTSAFGNFAAGALGEIWGTIPPVQFFLWTTLVVGAAALVLLALVRLVTSMMHGVN